MPLKLVVNGIVYTKARVENDRGVVLSNDTAVLITSIRELREQYGRHTCWQVVQALKKGGYVFEGWLHDEEVFTTNDPNYKGV